MKINKSKKLIIIGFMGLLTYWGVIFRVYLPVFDPSPSILLETHSANNIEKKSLLSGTVISQEITSKTNNLGIIAIRFKIPEQGSDDTLVFRLKEKGDRDWYYEANYKTDQFQDRQLFPFGFPPIENSKGKTYQIEIESLHGSNDNFVKVDNSSPVIITKHQYQLSNINLLSLSTYLFIFQKIINVVSCLSISFHVLYLFIPILVYLLIRLRIYPQIKLYKLFIFVKNNKNKLLIISLFIYWIIFSFIYLQRLDPSPSILLEEHKVVNSKGKELYTSAKITEDFSPRYNNLGIVALRFQTFRRINDDTLVFRLKEKGDRDWYYEANYKTDQFQDRQLFPFGFPPIENSKGKTYQIEIESLHGSNDNFVKVDNLIPILISKHQYPVRTIDLKSTQTYIYLLKKIFNIVSNFALFYPIVFYLLPLILFILLRIKLINKNNSLKYILIVLPIIFFVSRQNLMLPQPGFWEINLLVAWSIYLLENKISPNLNLVVALIALLYASFHLIETNNQQAEEGVYWLLMILTIAVLHNFILSISGVTKQVSLREYFLSIFGQNENNKN